MGLFDWLSGLFSSKSGEENKDSENNIERNDDKSVETIQNIYEKNEAQDQIHNDLEAQKERDTESKKAEPDELETTEVDIRHNKDELQETNPR